ncbi:type III secretion system inner rod subunit SctI [Parachitinimonas caeni]|uniref:Type III secretion system inner rod subunit SctI n=1 Tax=Parachitinimonas caeni TaxID=3031301 RepID=A0ABT7DTW1_9NEIS|nr:type III secretion system inner rod subunit SctI [Parachitinimonas caeni]MDK2123493.1 type III secretion system inner rod subunit SctI [Parachitinimonas caeni]
MEPMLITLTGAAGVTAAPAAVPATANSADVARFAEAMAPQAGTGAPQVAGPVATTVTETAPPEVKTVGDAILDSLRSVNQDVQSKWGQLQSDLSDPAHMSSITDMLRMQMQLTQMSVQFELVGKAISRSTQNIEQLIKIQ